MIIPKENLSKLEVDRLKQVQEIINDALSIYKNDTVDVIVVRHEVKDYIPQYYVAVITNKIEGSRTQVNMRTIEEIRRKLAEIDVYFEGVSAGDEEGTLELWFLEDPDSHRLQERANRQALDEENSTIG